MYVRGSNQGIEFNRDDQSFYKGIIVKNNDPEMLFRCKVYLPEISNQPLDDWLKAFANGTIKTKFPGTNNPTDNWSDVQIFHEISKLIPWAEACLPITGEYGPARFFSPGDIATVSETDYVEGFETNNVNPPTLEIGSFAPSQSYANDETNLPDKNADPLINFTAFDNPYAREYQPANYTESAKGTFAIPKVGAQVWVFHYRGDLNFPVYFGGRNSARDNATIFSSITGAQGSSTPPSDSYPGSFENKHHQQDTPPETTESEIPAGARPPEPGPLSPTGYRATAYGNVMGDDGSILDATTRDDIARGDIKEEWQYMGNRGNRLVPGYSVASNKFPHGTKLLINGQEYRVDDTGGMSDNVIDFYSGGDREMYNEFANMQIESITVL